MCPTNKIDIVPSGSIKDLVIQDGVTMDINVVGRIFKFLNIGFRQKGANFKLTKLPKLTVYRAEEFSDIIRASENNAGEFVTAYIVSDGFSFCSEDIDDLMINANQTAAAQGKSAPYTITSPCKDISGNALPTITTGETTPTPSPTTTTSATDSIVSAVKTKVESVLTEGSFSLSRQSNEFTIASSDKPLMVAWQTIKFDPKKAKTKKFKKDIKFATASPNIVTVKQGNTSRYKIEIGNSDESFFKANNLDSRCVHILVTALGSTDKAFPLVGYCPTASQFNKNKYDLTGYTRNPRAMNLDGITLSTFFDFDSIVVPRLTIKNLFLSKDELGGLRTTGEVIVEESKTPWNFVTN